MRAVSNLVRLDDRQRGQFGRARRQTLNGAHDGTSLFAQVADIDLAARHRWFESKHPPHMAVTTRSLELELQIELSDSGMVCHTVPFVAITRVSDIPMLDLSSSVGQRASVGAFSPTWMLSSSGREHAMIHAQAETLDLHALIHAWSAAHLLRTRRCTHWQRPLADVPYIAYHRLESHTPPLPGSATCGRSHAPRRLRWHMAACMVIFLAALGVKIFCRDHILLQDRDRAAFDDPAAGRTHIIKPVVLSLEDCNDWLPV